MALFAFFIENGKHVTILVNFIEVPDTHTEVRLGQEVEGVLDDFGVADKVIYATHSTTQGYLLLLIVLSHDT